jgi:hypothetical protein
MIGTSPLILFAGMDADSKDFKTYMKTSSSKSAPPAIAHSGSGSVSHLAAEMLSIQSKIKFNLVPYRGSAPALTDVAAGIVSGHIATLASGASALLAEWAAPPAAAAGGAPPPLPSLLAVMEEAAGGLLATPVDAFHAYVIRTSSNSRFLLFPSS